MRLAIDLDDVIRDYWGRVVRCYNTEFGTDVSFEDTTDWDNNTIKTDCPLGNWWTEWWSKRPSSVIAGMEVIPGAIGGLEKLHQGGHYIEVLTNTPRWARPGTNEWFAKWHLNFDRLTYVDGESKPEASDAHVLIDDHLKNIREWRLSGRSAIVFTRPWNTSRPQVPSYRVKSWTGIVNAVNYIERQEA